MVGSWSGAIFLKRVITSSGWSLAYWNPLRVASVKRRTASGFFVAKSRFAARTNQ